MRGILEDARPSHLRDTPRALTLRLHSIMQLLESQGSLENIAGTVRHPEFLDRPRPRVDVTFPFKVARLPGISSAQNERLGSRPARPTRIKHRQEADSDPRLERRGTAGASGLSAPPLHLHFLSSRRLRHHWRINESHACKRTPSQKVRPQQTYRRVDQRRFSSRHEPSDFSCIICIIVYSHNSVIA